MHKLFPNCKFYIFIRTLQYHAGSDITSKFFTNSAIEEGWTRRPILLAG